MSVNTSPARKEKKDLQDKILPSLSVKPDPTLKSCLSSTTSLNKLQILVVGHTQDHDENIQSPLGSNFVPITSPNLNPNSNANPTPAPPFMSSIASPLTSPHILSSPSSILSSTPNSPPVLQPQPTSFKVPSSITPILAPHPAISTTSPPLSRISSLRYVNSTSDKKIIESTNRQRTASPTISSLNSSPKFPPIDSLQDEDVEKKHLMIAITGCISIHKNVFLMIDKLFELYTREKLEIQVILTKAAQWFFTDKLHKFEELGVKVWFHDDGMKYYLTKKLVNPIKLPQNPRESATTMKLTASLLSQYVLAFELQKWTDVLLIAPLLANTMAKLINGMSDNLLTEMLHLWPIPLNFLGNDATTTSNATTSTVLTNNLTAPKPIISALALTNSMYSHPITKRQLIELKETYPNMSILKPVEKCVDVDGNIAMGGMRSWREVVNFVVQKLGEPEEDEEGEDGDGDEDEDDKDDDEDEDDEDDKNDEVVELGRENESGGGEGNYKDSYLHRHRGDTVSNKELKEHQKIATINAMLNTGMSANQTRI